MYEYEGVRGQRDELRRDLEERDEEIRRLQAQVKELQDSYQSLKTAKMLEIYDGDVETANRIADKTSGQVHSTAECIRKGKAPWQKQVSFF